MTAKIFTDFWNVMGLMYDEDLEERLKNDDFEFTKWTFDIRRLETCINAMSKILESLKIIEENIPISDRYAVEVYVARKKSGDFGILLLKPYIAEKGLHIALAGLKIEEEEDVEEADAE